METTCPQCDGPVIQTGKGRPKRFCSRKCSDNYYNDQKPRKYKHHDPRCLLTDIDTTARRATCSQHGPNTRIYSAGSTRLRWRCAEKVDAQLSRRAAVDPIVQRVRKLRGNGVIITLEEYVAAVESAAGCCQLCGREADLHTDHCHTTRLFRGLLCSTCNTGLGKFGDDPAKLRAAADYLEAAQVKTGVRS